MNIEKKSTSIGFGMTFRIAGLIFFAASIIWGVRTLYTVTTAQRAEGVVFAVKENAGTYNKGRKTSSTYHPVVRYSTSDGKEIEFTSRLGSGFTLRTNGELVTVLYDPARPEAAEIDSFLTLWLAPLIFGMFGILLSIVGYLDMRGGVRERARRKRLNEAGVRVVSQLQGVEAIPGTKWWRVVAETSDQVGNRRIFKSGAIDKDPSPMLAGRTTIDVVVDPADHNTYEMDLAFLQGAPDGSATANH